MASKFRNPIPTVDIIIECGEGKIVLIKRKNPPRKWALPGGFVDYKEKLEKAAVREAFEETSLKIILKEQLLTYSAPDRDCRKHTISTVFIGKIDSGEMKAADDAVEIGCFSKDELPDGLAFDHARIVEDYFNYLKTGKPPRLG